ncbi:hypothetical protein FEM03_20795 [Phragmitibacter flavus]|uniref:Uncharacterized protein n=1 Tax=Phragmitibacter flavus TaxID=2576071 RepID=A0A5R8KA43_9BACT|nr:hypothetical protein FEM03_20795 [Phragmitibacter flavus]
MLGIVAFFLLVFFPLCLLLWHWMMHRIGGWGRLAANYGATVGIEGKQFRGYGSVGLMPQNFLSFTANDEGLRIKRLQFFDRVNKPLFIPWKDFHGLRPGKSYTKETMVVLDIGRPVVGRLLLPVRVLQQSAGKVLLVEAPPATAEAAFNKEIS